MGRIVTIDEILNGLSERTRDNTRQLRHSNTQRRNGMEDLYGIGFSASGDGEKSSNFYISLSPDYVYIQRFAFKFVIEPFEGTAPTSWQITIAGVDITPYLEEQQGSSPLFTDAGIYPNSDLTEYQENFYDILDVCSVMIAEDTEESIENAKKILKPKFKKVEIKANAPFNLDAYLYLKYSNTNR